MVNAAVNVKAVARFKVLFFILKILPVKFKPANRSLASYKVTIRNIPQISNVKDKKIIRKIFVNKIAEI